MSDAESGLHLLITSNQKAIMLLLSFFTYRLFYTCLNFFLSFGPFPVCFSSFLSVVLDLELNSNEWKEVYLCFILQTFFLYVPGLYFLFIK